MTKASPELMTDYLKDESLTRIDDRLNFLVISVGEGSESETRVAQNFTILSLIQIDHLIY